MKYLFSKLIAGGVSACLILLWWPHFFSQDAPSSWLLRGIAWTFVFEILLLSLMPLENSFWKHTKFGQWYLEKTDHWTNHFNSKSATGQVIIFSVVAVVVLAIPVGLIFRATPVSPKPAVVNHVTKVTKVVKPVEVKKIYVQKTVTEAVPQVNSVVPQTKTKSFSPVKPKTIKKKPVVVKAVKKSSKIVIPKKDSSILTKPDKTPETTTVVPAAPIVQNQDQS